MVTEDLTCANKKTKKNESNSYCVSVLALAIHSFDVPVVA